MTSSMRKGLLVALLHLAIVSTLGAKLLADRAMRPRVWARAAPVDPNLPIRGRYLSLMIELEPAAGFTMSGGSTPVSLAAQGGRLVASPAAAPGRLLAHAVVNNGRRFVVLDEPVAYFIPEHVPDPSRRASSEELWVEVTLPRAGAPRPIRLGVKKNGVLTPLEID